jgi:hypothetical protein
MFLLAYGSLVADLPGDPLARPIKGLARRWNVAMDNRVDLPGYKFYVDAHTGKRHEGHVAFLDLVEDDDVTLNGLLFELDGDALDALDRRERNYERVDVTELVADPPGPVAAYVGTSEARIRFDAALGASDVVASAAYSEHVRAAFAAYDELPGYEQSTDHPPCPYVNLARIDL